MDTTARSTRRSALKLLGGAGLALAVVHNPKPADAAIAWCRADPVLKIDGQVVDVWLESYDAMRASATGPVKLKVTVPSNTSVQVLASDRGFGYGYAISVATSSTLKKTATSTPVRVEAYAPARDGSLPLQVNQAPRSGGPVLGGTTQGVANAWVVLQTA